MDVGLLAFGAYLPRLRLSRKAAAANTTVDKLVESVLEKATDSNAAMSPLARVAAWDAFVAGMRGWGERNLPAGHVVDDSRERIYEGRGE